jgi:hypothetical protein
MYIICAPPYSFQSAGIKISYELSRHLNDRGYEAYVYVWDGKPHSYEKYKTCSLEFEARAAGAGAWIVYPEIISGNPIGAKNVVRYVLNVPGLLGGDKTYAPNEKLFAYNSYISQHAWGCPILRVSPIDLDKCRDFGYPRKGSCYFVYKGYNVRRRPEFEELQLVGLSQEELFDRFNRSEVFYTYDDMTAAADEARLCGCPVVILNEDSDKHALLDENKFGLAYNTDELQWAKDTVHLYRERYMEQYVDEFEKQLEVFLETTNYGHI